MKFQITQAGDFRESILNPFFFLVCLHVERFPNLHVLLRIACTLPVKSYECEHSASALRRLMNYMRSSMGAEQQTNLALTHIPYEQKIDLNEVVDIFAKLRPRQLQLQSTIKPAQDEQ